MNPRLEQLKKSLESALESAVDGMSSEQLSWHFPGKWCASVVLEHLYLTHTGTIKGFERVRLDVPMRHSIAQVIRGRSQ